MPFRARSTRTTQHVQPAAIAFAEFTADHPHLHLDTVQISAGTVTIHLHGTHALEHLAHWEEILGNCARSSGSFPSSHDARLHYTERLTAVVAGTAFEAVAFHDGPGAYDPHGMIRPARNQASIASRADRSRVPASPQTTPTRRCAVALSVTAALAITVITAAAISQRVKPLRPLRAPKNR
ncbi:hypothetical protein ACFYY1_29910 [Streptomyces sp. NPDC001890]|uniref:hypothetical protein n=1 Tax=Streptomyces sp. NPDC001890 TaxID=3364620 RepID=UPI0036CADA97